MPRTTQRKTTPRHPSALWVLRFIVLGVGLAGACGGEDAPGDKTREQQIARACTAVCNKAETCVGAVAGCQEQCETGFNEAAGLDAGLACIPTDADIDACITAFEELSCLQAAALVQSSTLPEACQLCN